MTLTLVGFSSNGGNAQNPTCPVVTGVAIGDLLVTQWSTGAAFHTPPTGYTDDTQVGTSSLITWWVWKFADSGDTTGASRTYSQGGTTPTRLSQMAFRASGGDTIDPTNPIDVTGFISTTTTASANSPSVSAPADGWVVEAADVRGATSFSSSPPAGYVEIYDQTTSTGSPAKSNTAMYGGASNVLDAITSGTTIGGHTFTAASSVAAGELHAHTIFIRKVSTGPTSVTMSADATMSAVLPGPLMAGIHNPAVVMYLSHRGGADILPAETLTAYLDPVNDHHGWEGDAYLLQNSGSDSDDDRLAAVHDTDMASVPLYQSNGSVVTAGSDVTTTSITTWDTNIYQKNPITNALVHVTRWKAIFEAVRQSTGGGFYPYGRFFAIENKAAGTLTPIINSLTSRGLVNFALANTFDYTRCTQLAAAGLHVMWLTTSFATNSAASAKAAGIEWVGWQAGTAGFSTFLAAAHAAGLYVNVYDVQTASQRDTYTAQGVEMISTDRPDLVYPSAAWTGTAAIATTATVTSAGSRGTSTGASVAATAAVTATGTVAKAGGASVSETAGVTSAGVRGRSAGTSLAATAAIAADGIVSSARGATLSETAAVTSAGVLGKRAGVALPGTASVASTGVRGQSVGSTIASTAAISADGSTSGVASGSASLTSVVTITAAGVVSKSGGASLAETAAVAADGLLAKSGGTSLAETGTVAADGALGRTSGADLAQIVAVTSAGLLGRTDGSALTQTTIITSAGVLGRVDATSLAALATLTADGILGQSAAVTIAATVAIEADGSVQSGSGVEPDLGTILATRLHIPTVRGELRIPEIRGDLSVPTVRGVLR